MLREDELVEAPYVGTDNQLPPDAYELQGCMPALVVKHIETLAAQAKDASLVKRGDGVLTVDEIHAAVRVLGLDPDEFDQRVALLSGVVTKEWVEQTLQLHVELKSRQSALLRAPPSAVADRVAEFARVYNAHSGRTLPAGVAGVSSLAVVMEGIEHPIGGLFLRATAALDAARLREGAQPTTSAEALGLVRTYDATLFALFESTQADERDFVLELAVAAAQFAKTYIEAETTLMAREPPSVASMLGAYDTLLVEGRTTLLKTQVKIDPAVDEQLATWAAPYKTDGLLTYRNEATFLPEELPLERPYDYGELRCWSWGVAGGFAQMQVRTADPRDRAYIPIRARAKLATLLRLHVGFLFEASSDINESDPAYPLFLFARLEAPRQLNKRPQMIQTASGARQMTMAEYAAAHILHDEMPSVVFRDGRSDGQCLARAVVAESVQFNASDATAARASGYDVANYEELGAFLKQTDPSLAPPIRQDERLDLLHTYVRLVLKTSMRGPEVGAGYSWFGTSLAARRFLDASLKAIAVEGDATYARGNPARAESEPEVSYDTLLLVEGIRRALARNKRASEEPTTPGASGLTRPPGKSQRLKPKPNSARLLPVWRGLLPYEEEDEPMEDAEKTAGLWPVANFKARLRMEGFTMFGLFKTKEPYHSMAYNETNYTPPQTALSGDRNSLVWQSNGSRPLPDWAKDDQGNQILYPVYGRTNYSSVSLVSLVGAVGGVPFLGNYVNYRLNVARDERTQEAALQRDAQRREADLQRDQRRAETQVRLEVVRADQRDPIYRGQQRWLPGLAEVYQQDRVLNAQRAFGSLAVPAAAARGGQVALLASGTGASVAAGGQVAATASSTGASVAAGALTGTAYAIGAGAALLAVSWAADGMRWTWAPVVKQDVERGDMLDEPAAPGVDLRWVWADSDEFRTFEAERLAFLRRTAREADAAQNAADASGRQVNAAQGRRDRSAPRQRPPPNVRGGAPSLYDPNPSPIQPLVADGAPAPAADAPAAADGGAAAAAP